jgi:hypothetical protein
LRRVNGSNDVSWIYYSTTGRIKTYREKLHYIMRWYRKDQSLLPGLESGTNVVTRDGEGWTQLHRHYAACDNGRSKVVQLLLDHGAHVNAQGEDRRTALHVAAYSYWGCKLWMCKVGSRASLKTTSAAHPFSSSSGTLPCTAFAPSCDASRSQSPAFGTGFPNSRSRTS